MPRIAPSDTESIVIQPVWLRPHEKGETGHVYEDYLQTPHGPFLAELALCGTRRDPALRIPANFRKVRVCLRCSRGMELRDRRAAERRRALAQYGTKKASTDKWTMRKPGRYTLGKAAAICREKDGLWHVYVHKTRPPGDSTHPTLRAAKIHVSRMMTPADEKREHA
jgi:hypothetical protein